MERPDPVAATRSPPERRELCPGAWIDLWPRAIANDRAWLDRLVAELPLARETYRIANRTVSSPRLVAWHGDPGAEYVYSGTAHVPEPWTPSLVALRGAVEERSGLQFNAVLVNHYRDGADSMGWHADAEPEVGPTVDDRWIASVSLGAPRRFLLRHRRRPEDLVELALGDGDLLVMRGTTQTHYRHAAPRTARPVGPRMSLTFRHIRKSASRSSS